jgi:hypothetical protein
LEKPSVLLWVELSSAGENHFFISSYLIFLFLFLQECYGAFLLANLTVLHAHRPLFKGGWTTSRRLFAWAGERRRRPSEPQFASPPVATRNGLAQPMRIGAPGASEQHLDQ